MKFNILATMPENSRESVRTAVIGLNVAQNGYNLDVYDTSWQQPSMTLFGRFFPRATRFRYDSRDYLDPNLSLWC